jgi:hypothetical protein
MIGQVDIELAFSPVPSETPYLGYSMQPMNASMAMEYIGLSDLVLSARLSGFLGDSTRSIDLTPSSERAKPCGLNGATQSMAGSSCKRTYFVPGQILAIAPELLFDASFPAADTTLTKNHQGFLLEFDTGDSSLEFDAARECRTYSGRYFGVTTGAVRLCVGDSGLNGLQARTYRL